jgi:2',3'-cyclic-nucleotide 2'-phosphodiesterase / 3'-nucleotidase / 5'-nucleotidase
VDLTNESFLTQIGSFTGSGAEISAYDAATQRLFVISGGTELEILDLSDPTNPTLVDTLDVSDYGGGANSVAISNGVVAVAVAADPPTDPGTVAFFTSQGRFLNAVEVGALPDMLTFTPDGSKVLVANEGEPSEDYTIDPSALSISLME